MPKIISLSSLSRSKFDKIKKDFNCSHKELETHIKQYAYSHQKEGLFQTYFFTQDDKYLGYVSVAISSIDREKIQKDEIAIPTSINYEIPALKITRLCIFDEYLKQNVGTVLISFIEILAVTLQSTIGCRAVIVDSKEEAVDFYKKFDFVEIAPQDDDDTVFMVYDLLKPKDLLELVPDMIEFCEYYGQEDLIKIL